MKKLILFFVLLPIASFSQISLGSAKKLSGSIKINAVFVNGDSSLWTKKEKDKYLSVLYKNMGWLSIKGRQYKANISFSIDTSNYFSPLSIFKNREKEEIGKIVNKYANNDQYGYSLSKKADNFLFVFFVKCDGRSFAERSIEISPNMFIEYSVIFYSYWPDIDGTESVMAHEVMHCFGANDLYDDSDNKKDEKLQKIFPNEIMRYVGNLNNLLISRYTANTIGWIKGYTKEFGEINRIIIPK